MTALDEPEVAIGTVVAPFGIKGEVKVRIETDFPDRFETLREVWLRPRSGLGRMVGVESARFHQGVVLVKFEGCDDRNRAEDLRGAELRIDRTQLRKLEGDQYYVHDILGLDVYTTGGEHLGKVTEVLRGVANDVYVTPRALIPALKQVVREIDLAQGKMIIEPVAGLVEDRD